MTPMAFAYRASASAVMDVRRVLRGTVLRASVTSTTLRSRVRQRAAARHPTGDQTDARLSWANRLPRTAFCRWSTTSCAIGSPEAGPREARADAPGHRPGPGGLSADGRQLRRSGFAPESRPLVGKLYPRDRLATVERWQAVSGERHR